MLAEQMANTCLSWDLDMLSKPLHRYVGISKQKDMQHHSAACEGGGHGVRQQVSLARCERDKDWARHVSLHYDLVYPPCVCPEMRGDSRAVISTCHANTSEEAG